VKSPVLATQELALKVRTRGQEYNPFKARRALENRQLRPEAAKKRRKGSKPDGSAPSADVQARHLQGHRLAEAFGELFASSQALRGAGLEQQTLVGL